MQLASVYLLWHCAANLQPVLWLTSIAKILHSDESIASESTVSAGMRLTMCLIHGNEVSDQMNSIIRGGKKQQRKALDRPTTENRIVA